VEFMPVFQLKGKSYKMLQICILYKSVIGRRYDEAIC
jgi:hypothetical protein